LAPKSAETLAVLVENAGQLVDKDDLMRRVWPDAFVEEVNLAKNVFFLRKTLGMWDGGREYIETVPKRGYRFVAPVNEVTQAQGQAWPGGREKRPGTLGVGRRGQLLATAIIVVVAVITGIWVGGVVKHHNPTKLTDKDAIVVGDFANTTGNKVFDGTLRQALAIQLEQSPFLNVISDQKVSDTLKLMTRPANEPLTADVAREVCLRTDSKATLIASIAPMGEHFLVAAKAVDCRSGDTLASAEAEAQNRNQVLKSLQDVGNQLRSNLGESLASVQKFNTPLEEATTSSLEALQAFSQGRRAHLERGSVAAVPYYNRALELDGNFAYAYAALGNAYFSLFEKKRAAQNYEKAYQLRERVSPRERFYIEAGYYEIATGDRGGAIQSSQQWVDSYPRDHLAYLNLGWGLMGIGQHDKAASELRKALTVMPGNSPSAYNLMLADMALGQLDEAKTVFEEARARHPDEPALHMARYFVGFLAGDNAAMREQVEWARGQPSAEDSIANAQALTDVYYGRMARARAFFQQANASARRAGATERASRQMAKEGQAECEIGNHQRARQKSLEALRLSGGGDVLAMASTTLARVGDLKQALRVAGKLDREFPLDTEAQSQFIPAVRAIIETQHGNPAKAVEILKVATPYELGYGAALYCIYIRGLAFLKVGKGEEAAREFQKVIDHRGIITASIHSSLSRLYLARAQVMMGDKAAARKSYQDFLTLWKDADPDIPIYKEAKAEYAKLK
jgi:tetratricopeptide (TPR) repeat protein